MTLANLIAGAHMLTSYADFPLQSVYGKEWTDHIIEIATENRSMATHPEMVPLIDKSINDWRNTPFELRNDIARPLRAFFGLGELLSNDLTRSPLRTPDTHGGTLNWLFIIESVLVLLLTVRCFLRQQPIDDRLGVLLLLIVPTWAYVFVLCTIVRPYGVYMEATSSFVYIALLMGGWTVVTTAAKKLPLAGVGKPSLDGSIVRGSIAQAE
jgi:hypothetical protein